MRVSLIQMDVLENPKDNLNKIKNYYVRQKKKIQILSFCQKCVVARMKIVRL